MKKFMVPIMILAILTALYEQSKSQPNIYIIIGAILIFMYGMMRLSAKIPGRKDKKDDDV